MKPTFLGHDKPLYTVMIQKRTPEEYCDTIAKARAAGADAVGLQFENLLLQYRNEESYKAIFAAAAELPTYVTYYTRTDFVDVNKTDDDVANELIKIVKCGGTLVDVMGDIFCKTEGELTDDPEAVAKQKKLIEEIHALGGEVLMSSHVLKYTKSDRVMEIANAHKERGADISKIVTDANTDTEQIDNLMIIDRLKRELELPFLFLCSNKCEVLRRIGPMFGCCMWLTVFEHDDLSTKTQPEILKVKAIMNGFK